MTPVQHRRRKYQKIDWAYILRTAIAVACAVAIVAGISYAYGTQNGWAMKVACEAGTALNPELC
jgi:DNA-binding helix-hairpin-helix protein with protein kinase domain